MSASSVPAALDMARDRRIPLGVLRDTVAIARRNLIAYVRIPQLLVFSTIQPVVFVLMFRYVFGGAITGLPPGVTYVDYLMPGIFVQTVVFGAIATAIGLATDMKSGAHGAVPRVAHGALRRAHGSHHRGLRAQRVRGDPHDGGRIPGGLDASAPTCSA